MCSFDSTSSDDYDNSGYYLEVTYGDYIITVELTLDGRFKDIHNVTKKLKHRQPRIVVFDDENQ